MNKINKDWINEWKDNFCKHISDWSYITASEELDKFIQDILTQQQEEIIERLEKWDPMLKSPRLPNKDYSEGFRNGIDDAIRIIKEK